MKSPKPAAGKAGFLAALIAACLTVSAQTVTESGLEQACASLLRSPDGAELQTLLDASRQNTTSPALRSRATAAYSLTLLLQGNTNAFERAMEVLRASHPDAAKLIKVSRSDCFATCEDCMGSGGQTTLCPLCMGSGKCKPCAGTGLKDGAPCPTCRIKGYCAMCEGKKRIKNTCPACKGTLLMFKPSQKIRDNFNTLLAEIVSICQDNAKFAEQFRLASLEADPEKRIALFKALLQAFPRRDDLGPVKTLLERSIIERNAQANLRNRQMAREQADRELESLRTLRDSDNLTVAIATLATYLKEHPDSSSQLELQTLLDELVARRNRKALAKRLLYGAASLLGTLILLGCLKPFLFRKKTEAFGPLPGMDKIDKSQFTDPLSLTARESRSRVKTKTSEIAPPNV